MKTNFDSDKLVENTRQLKTNNIVNNTEDLECWVEMLTTVNEKHQKFMSFIRNNVHLFKIYDTMDEEGNDNLVFHILLMIKFTVLWVLAFSFEFLIC